MRAGRLRQRIIIQKPVRTKNAMGEEYDEWTTWVTVWSSIEPSSGKDYFEAKQANSEVDGKVVIRYLTGLKPTFRIKYGQRILQIISIVQPQERRTEIQIMYKENLD